MTVLVEPSNPGSKVLEEPGVTQGIDRLATFLQDQPHVGNVANLAHLIKLNNSFIHDEDAAYLQVPSSQYEVGQILLDTADRSPGVYSWLYTNDLSSAW